MGLRLDYEKIWMDYNSVADPTNFDFSLKMATAPRPIVSTGLEGNAAYIGKESADYVQLLPKFALQYEWKKGNNVYATAARGYRSGDITYRCFLT